MRSVPRMALKRSARNWLRREGGSLNAGLGMDLEEKDTSGTLIHAFSTRKGIPDGILDYIQNPRHYILRRGPWDDLP